MDDVDDVAGLVRKLAEDQRQATPREAVQIHQLFTQRGLPQTVTRRVLQKHGHHVDERGEWPSDTTPDEYLESLRSMVADVRTAIYATFAIELDEWVIYFVGRVRRAWRGPRAGQRVVVLFTREPQRWITGFQARDGDAYVESQGGYWVYQPR